MQVIFMVSGLFLATNQMKLVSVVSFGARRGSDRVAGREATDTSLAGCCPRTGKKHELGLNLPKVPLFRRCRLER
jgi:hypothetical protein